MDDDWGYPHLWKPPIDTTHCTQGGPTPAAPRLLFRHPEDPPFPRKAAELYALLGWWLRASYLPWPNSWGLVNWAVWPRWLVGGLYYPSYIGDYINLIRESLSTKQYNGKIEGFWTQLNRGWVKTYHYHVGIPGGRIGKSIYPLYCVHSGTSVLIHSQWW